MGVGVGWGGGYIIEENKEQLQTESQKYKAFTRVTEQLEDALGPALTSPSEVRIFPPLCCGYAWTFS